MFSRLQILPVRKLVIRWATFLGLLVVGVGCDRNALNPTPVQPFANDVSKSEKPPVVDPVVAEARRQIGVTTVYDPSYVGLAYPGGDVPADRGVCTDVVIRALRNARGWTCSNSCMRTCGLLSMSIRRIGALKKQTETLIIGECRTCAGILSGKDSR